MKFLLVLVVVLPMLPNEGMGPGDIYNPRELGYLVVLITGISFVGYFAIRFLGRRRGISLTGLLGGLASSTAVTLAMSHRVKNAQGDRVVRLAAVFAILMANAIMSVRVTIVVAAVNPDFVGMLLVPVIAMAVPGSLVAAYLWYKMAKSHPEGGEGVPDKAEAMPGDGTQSDEQLHITNPFRIGPALKFGLIFVVIIGLVHLAKIYFGSAGTYVAALISGLAEANAISIAIARMQEAGDINAVVATRGVVIAILANSFVKAAICSVVGTKRLGLYVALGLVPMLAAGTVAVLLVG